MELALLEKFESRRNKLNCWKLGGLIIRKSRLGSRSAQDQNSGFRIIPVMMSLVARCSGPCYQRPQSPSPVPSGAAAKKKRGETN